MKAELGSGAASESPALEQGARKARDRPGLRRGQFKLPDEDAERLNELDNEAVGAAEVGDEGRFQELCRRCSTSSRGTATRSTATSAIESDVILPPRDISFEEAQGEFTGDGLIPD